MDVDFFFALVRQLNAEFRDPSCRKPDAGTGIFTGGSYARQMPDMSDTVRVGGAGAPTGRGLPLLPDPAGEDDASVPWGEAGH